MIGGIFGLIVALDKRDERRVRASSLEATDEEQRIVANNQTRAENSGPNIPSEQAGDERWNPEEKAHKQQERVHWRNQTGISIATLILTLVAVCGAIASAYFASQALTQANRAATAAEKQLGAVNESNGLSRKALIVDQRPWVTVDIKAVGPISWSGPNPEVPYIITIKNIGKSPAINVRHIESIVLGVGADVVAQLRNLADSFLGAQHLAGGWAIMPNDDRGHIMRQQVNRERIDKEKMPWTPDSAAKLIQPVLVGVVYYTTELDTVTHQTGFIYEIGFWDPAKGITVTALDPSTEGDIPLERVRIRRHPDADGYVD